MSVGGRLTSEGISYIESKSQGILNMSKPGGRKKTENVVEHTDLRQQVLIQL